MSAVSAGDALDLLGAATQVAQSAVSRAASISGDRRTPCAQWDLRTLIRHLADSAATIERLLEGLPDGPAPPAGCAAATAALASLRSTTERLRSSTPPTAALAALVGSYELTLHAWDIAESTECGPALEPELVTALLINAQTVSVGTRRAGLFAEERRPDDETDPELHLLALFGRSRGWRRPRDIPFAVRC